MSSNGDRNITWVPGHRNQTFESWVKSHCVSDLRLIRTTSGGGVAGAEAKLSDKVRNIFARRCSGIAFSTSWRTFVSGLTTNSATGRGTSNGEGLGWVNMATSKAGTGNQIRPRNH